MLKNGSAPHAANARGTTPVTKAWSYEKHTTVRQGLQALANTETLAELPLGGATTKDAASVGAQPYSSTSQLLRQEPAHGRIDSDIWCKTARGSMHMLRMPRAWALNVADLASAEACGARVVCIADTEQLREYWAACTTIGNRGFTVDRGHGRQKALLLSDWRPTRSEAEMLAEEPQAPGAPLLQDVL